MGGCALLIHIKKEYLKKQIAQIEAKLDEDMRNLEQVALVIRQKGGAI